MTWSEWVASDYNTVSYAIVGNSVGTPVSVRSHVSIPSPIAYNDNTKVAPSDTITSNYDYSFFVPASGGAGE